MATATARPIIAGVAGAAPVAVNTCGWVRTTGSARSGCENPRTASTPRLASSTTTNSPVIKALVRMLRMLSKVAASTTVRARGTGGNARPAAAR